MITTTRWSLLSLLLGAALAPGLALAVELAPGHIVLFA